MQVRRLWKVSACYGGPQKSIWAQAPKVKVATESNSTSRVCIIQSLHSQSIECLLSFEYTRRILRILASKSAAVGSTANNQSQHRPRTNAPRNREKWLDGVTGYPKSRDIVAQHGIRSFKLAELEHRRYQFSFVSFIGTSRKHYGNRYGWRQLSFWSWTSEWANLVFYGGIRH